MCEARVLLRERNVKKVLFRQKEVEDESEK